MRLNIILEKKEIIWGKYLVNGFQIQGKEEGLIRMRSRIYEESSGSKWTNRFSVDKD